MVCFPSNYVDQLYRECVILAATKGVNRNKLEKVISKIRNTSFQSLADAFLAIEEFEGKFAKITQKKSVDLSDTKIPAIFMQGYAQMMTTST